MTSIAINTNEVEVARQRARRPATSSRKTGIALWVVQSLLAALFLFAGSMKFIMSVAEMTKQIPFPGWFLHFIGAAEILGALGLILPGLLKIRTGLTPLAASGLVVIMIGATVTTLFTPAPAAAIGPLVIGVLAAFVAYGRARVAPLGN